MRGGSTGVRAYARPRRGAAAGLAVVAGALALGGNARADDADAPQVAPVTVTAKAGVETGLAVLPTTVQDTPQAISVIPPEQLKNQGVASLEQALRNVPGITIAIGEGGTLNGDQFKIRGFDAKDDVYLDGLRDFGAYTRDSFDYEEVQVLKGPSGALFGRGTTGGAINVVSKTPKLADFAEADGYLGNGSYERALVDINRQVGATSALRLNLMTTSAGVVDRDLITSHRWGAALSGAWGLGTDTTVAASYLHQQDRRRPDYGIVIVQKPGDVVALPATEYGVGVERSSFLGFRDDLDRSTADIATVRVTHRVSDRVTLTSDTRYGAYSRYFQYTTLDQCNAACTAALFDGNPATEAFGGIGGSSPYDMDAWGLQNISTARIDFDLGRFRNQAIVGVDLSKQVNDKLFYAYALPQGITTRPGLPHPIVDPDPNFPAGYFVFRAVPGVNLDCSGAGDCRTTVNGTSVFTNVTGAGTLQSHGESTDAGLFLTDRFWMTDSLSVIGSLRVDRYAAELDSLLYSGAASPPGGLKVKSTLTSPRLSLVWEPSPTRTFYASWGRSQTPQGTSIVGAGTALTVSAKDLAPEDSEVWELGAKFAVPRTGLSAAVSLFDVKKDNALQVDPATGFLLAQSGERQEVKGLELSLTGRITAAWSVSAGYTHLDDQIKESYSNCTVATTTSGTPSGIVCPVGATAAIPVLNTVAVGQQAAYTPKDAASFYTTYDLGHGLQIGGDVVWQSKLYLAYTARSASYADRATLVASRIAETPESLTFDAFASWTHGPYRIAVNGYNLADRLNYTQVFGNRAVPAAGRTVIVSIGLRY